MCLLKESFTNIYITYRINRTLFNIDIQPISTYKTLKSTIVRTDLLQYSEHIHARCSAHMPYHSPLILKHCGPHICAFVLNVNRIDQQLKKHPGIHHVLLVCMFEGSVCFLYASFICSLPDAFHLHFAFEANVLSHHLLKTMKPLYIRLQQNTYRSFPNRRLYFRLTVNKSVLLLSCYCLCLTR